MGYRIFYGWSSYELRIHVLRFSVKGKKLKVHTHAYKQRERDSLPYPFYNLKYSTVSNLETLNKTVIFQYIRIVAKILLKFPQKISAC